MTDLRGRVRTRDPETSWDAAMAQTPKRRELIGRAVLHLLRTHGPMSDEQMFAYYLERRRVDPSLPNSTPQAVRTIRHRLTLAGEIRNTRRRTRTMTGCTATVWALKKKASNGLQPADAN